MLSDPAKSLLLSAKQGKGLDARLYFIERQIGYRCWSSGGQKGGRKDVRELYREGLIEELFMPNAPPCFLTEKGDLLRRSLLNEAGIDR